jgi:uncharacterized protein YndB with AHSA1/START domain
MVCLGAAVLLAALAVVVGALLPERHRARSRARYATVPPERAWALLSDLEGWPRWHHDTTEVRRLPDRDGRPVYLQVGRHGEIPTIVDSSEPPRRLITRIPEDAGLGFHGTWRYEVVPDGGGCRVEITEEGVVENPLFRFVSRLSSRHATMNATLRALGEALGETARPEPFG